MRMLEERESALERQRLYGVYPALVDKITDPKKQGRVLVTLPWSPDHNGHGYQVWARLGVLMGGKNRGTWLIPDPGDEVMVMFEAGDPRRPYVVGALWNGQDAPPETMDEDGNNYLKTIASRRGIRITMDDKEAQETVTIRTPGGQTIVLKDGPTATIEVTDSNGNSVRLSPDGISLSTTKKLSINAGTIDITANMVTVNSGMSKFSGVVQADTKITNSIISASYSPGAGNIW